MAWPKKEKSICKFEGCGRFVLARGFCETHYARWRRRGDDLGVDTATKYDYPRVVLDSLMTYTEDCIIWPFSPGSNGRPNGITLSDGKRHLIPRVVCEIKHGPPPSPDHEAAHSCGKGNAGCINWAHLRWATHKENEQDKVIHGTVIRGEKYPHALITNAQAEEIRTMYKTTNLLQREIGALFGLKQSEVSKIVRNKAYVSATSERLPRRNRRNLNLARAQEN